jgi:hypothetical protein
VGGIDKKIFKNVIAEFAPIFRELKPLARELQNVLFPIREGAIFTGAFRDHIMYNGMIKAFSRAIGPLGKEEQAIAQPRPGPVISIVRRLWRGAGLFLFLGHKRSGGKLYDLTIPGMPNKTRDLSVHTTLSSLFNTFSPRTCLNSRLFRY